MRSAVYAFAAVAAAGIAYFLATAPVPKDDAAAGSAATVTAVSHDVKPDSGTVTLRVDDMHCPFACYPAVKSAIESQSNVLAVELDKQQAEGAIDNPQVVIKYDSGFDLTAALDALSKKGFAKHSIVQ
jgi:periplasmic mercuric ion binding protein